MSEWGNPGVSNSTGPRIYAGSVTRRTETSKYPEENKSNEIPLVSGERKGNSPNRNLLRCCRTMIFDIVTIAEHRGIGDHRE